MPELNKIYIGDALEVLKTFPNEWVNCVVTSPPYWGLRNYGLEPQIWDGDENCKHVWGDMQGQTTTQWAKGVGNKGDTLADAEIRKERRISQEPSQGQFCQHCNAWCGSLGLEPTPELYTQHLVQIFRELKRVLRKDGTVWLNLGDTYAAYWGDKYGQPNSFGKQRQENIGQTTPTKESPDFRNCKFKPKDLIGIPWMVAFALRDDGWYLRSDIIWHKRNPMPESVTDRPTKSHEYIFLLSKSAKYYYDAESIAEPINEDTKRRYERAWNGDGERGYPGGVQNHIKNFMDPENEKRQWANKRSVWTVNTQPFSEAHFAVYPEKLIVPCILAGCPKDGIVLDPFIGSGTTFIVSRKLERNCVGIDLGYKDISDRRIYKELGMFK